MSIHPSRLIAECPLCHTPYGDEAVRLLRELEGSRLFHCSCQKCGRSMMALMLERSGWMSTVGLVTDLEAADAIRLEDAEAITSDECIRFTQVLEMNSQEFCRFLSGQAKK